MITLLPLILSALGDKTVKRHIHFYIFMLFFMMLGQITHASSTSSLYNSQNATVFIPAVDLVDNSGKIRSYQIWLKIISESPLLFELADFKLLENNFVGARAVYNEKEATNVVIPELPIPTPNGIKTFNATLTPIPNSNPLRFTFSNPTLNMPIWLNTSNNHYGTFDPVTNTLNLPVVSVPNGSGEADLYQAELVRDSNEGDTFELRSPKILSPQAVDKNGVYASYERETGRVFIPGIYIKTPNKVTSLRATFEAIPNTNPIRFKLVGLTEQPYFDGITQFTQTNNDSVKIKWQTSTNLALRSQKTQSNIHYEIHVSNQPKFIPTNETLKARVTNVSEYELNGLTQGVTYYLLVIAIDDEGKSSLERDYQEISPQTSKLSKNQSVTYAKVAPRRTKFIKHEDATLEINEEAVDAETQLSISVLYDEDLPKLSSGLLNVTKGARKGYRFLPHGQKFKNKIMVRIPFDRNLLPEGMTEQDIFTHYYDENAKQWIALERVSVDISTNEIVSYTDHFTDMVNAVNPCTLGAAYPDQYLCYGDWEEYSSKGNTQSNTANSYYYPAEGDAVIKHTLALYQYSKPEITEGHYLKVDSSYANRVKIISTPTFYPIYHSYVQATIEYTAPMELGKHDIPLHIYNSSNKLVSTGLLSKTIYSSIDVKTLPPAPVTPPTTKPVVPKPPVVVTPITPEQPPVVVIPPPPPPPPVDPCEGVPPPTIHYLNVSQNGKGLAFPEAKVTDQVGGLKVKLDFNGKTNPMTEEGKDIFRSDGVKTGKTGKNTYQVIATNSCGKSATFGKLSIPATDSGRFGLEPIKCNPTCASVGDPINTVNGNFIYQNTDNQVAGAGESDLRLTRTYNSGASLWISASTMQYTDNGNAQKMLKGPPLYFGLGWTSNLEAYALTINHSPYYEGVQILYPDGKTAMFKKSGDSYKPDSIGNYDELTVSNDGYILKRKESLQTWRFNSDGNLIEITDRNGNKVSYIYENGLLKQIQNNAGRTINFTLNSDKKIIKADLPEGITLRYEYSNGLLSAYIDGVGNRTEYQYSADKQLVKVITPKSHPTLRVLYDSEWRANEQIIGESERHTISYDTSKATVKDAYGHVSQHLYDDQDRVIKYIHPDNSFEEYAYDNDNNRTAHKDQAGGIWQHTFDKRGNRLTTTGPLGWYKEWQYNGQDRVKLIREKIMGTTSREFNLTYDNKSNVIKLCMPLGSCAEITYDDRGLPLNLKDLNGNITTNAYNDAGDLISVIDAEKSITSFENDGLGRVIAMKKPLGNIYRYTRNANNHLLAVDGPLGFHLGYQYDANSNLVLKTDPNGGNVSIGYNTSDKPIKIINQLGFDVATLSYGLMNELIGKKDAEGRAWKYDYNEMMRVVHIGAPLDTHFRFTYNPVGKIINAIDANGRVKHLEYDELYRPLTVIRNYIAAANPSSDTNVTTKYTYDLLGNILSVTDPEKYVFSFVYDVQGRKVAKKDAKNYEWEYSYDPMGNLLKEVDPNKHSNLIVYTPTYQVQKVINPENHAIQFVHNANGKLTDQIDAKGIVTHSAYNELDRLVTKVKNYKPEVSADHETNVITKYDHDLKGNLRFITNPRGYKAEIIYDAAHRRIQMVDYEQGLTKFFYDKVNNVLTVTDAESNSTYFKHDDLNRLIAVTNAENETKQYQYDPMGNRTHLIEADGTVALYEFDGVYRLNKVTQNYRAGFAAGNDVNVLTQYAHDARGLLTQIMNANNAQTTFEHDAVGNMVKETDPLANVWQYVYDGVKNKTRRIDAKGNQTDYVYYPDDLLKEIRYADNSAVQYSYDPNNNRTEMADWLGKTGWTYDPLNRLTAQTDAFNRTLQVAYDAASNRVGMTYPDGNQVSYAYSPNNWLKEAVAPEDNHTLYTRDKVSNIKYIANPNSTATDITHDKVYRTRTLKNFEIGGAGKTNSAYAYAYNKVGHVTDVEETFGWRQPDQVTETYTYDGLHRLAGVNIAPLKNNGDAVTMAYVYDPVGNRLFWSSNDNLSTQIPFDGFQKSYRYNAANQLLEMSNASEMPNGSYKALFSYDKNGNRINKLETDVNNPLYGTDYSYDYENRLNLIQDYQLVGTGDSNRIDRAYIVNEYDGGGRRMSKRYDPKQGGNDPTKHKRVEYVWDGLDPVAEYEMLNGQRTDFYRGANDRLMTMHNYQGGTQGNMYWYHHNSKGDVVGLTKHNGNSHHNYRYDPYGGVIADTGNFTEPHNHYTLTDKQFDEMQGKEFEEVTGLNYFGARYYEPQTGVWLNQDSYRGELSNPSSLHRFGYVENNPTSYWDWYGFAVALIFTGNEYKAGERLWYGVPRDNDPDAFHKKGELIRQQLKQRDIDLERNGDVKFFKDGIYHVKANKAEKVVAVLEYFEKNNIEVNYLHFIGHGDETGIFFDSAENTDGITRYKGIMKNDQSKDYYKDGDRDYFVSELPKALNNARISLHSCNTGKDNGVAFDFAAHFNSTVSAPSTYVGFEDNGWASIGPVDWMKGGRWRFINPDGTMVNFNP